MNRKIAIIFLCAIIKKKKERCELYYDLLTKNNQLILSAMSYRHQQLLWSFGLLGADGYCSVLPHQQTGKPCSHTHDEEEKKRSELNLTQWLQRLCACAHVLVYACILVCFICQSSTRGLLGYVDYTVLLGVQRRSGVHAQTSRHTLWWSRLQSAEGGLRKQCCPQVSNPSIAEVFRVQMLLSVFQL